MNAFGRVGWLLIFSAVRITVSSFHLYDVHPPGTLGHLRHWCSIGSLSIHSRVLSRMVILLLVRTRGLCAVVSCGNRRPALRRLKRELGRAHTLRYHRHLGLRSRGIIRARRSPVGQADQHLPDLIIICSVVGKLIFTITQGGVRVAVYQGLDGRLVPVVGRPVQCTALIPVHQVHIGLVLHKDLDHLTVASNGGFRGGASRTAIPGVGIGFGLE
mmetsp:Transcript_17742/g.39125  ORF Transcript_17742/g.39125 Transcript_17742/m.39125 type:complete len:215 (-) Transcript_17742:110-754(-)